ncbi:hypothetical protein D3C80_965050 [compost metagenome]
MAAEFGMGQHHADNGYQCHQHRQPDQHAPAVLRTAGIVQRGVEIGQNAPAADGDDDRRGIAQRGEQEQSAVVFGQLEIAGHGESDKEPQVHPGVVPQKGRFAPIVIRFKALGQHHINAGDVQPAAGQEHRQPPIKPPNARHGDQCTTDHLQHHAQHEQVAVAEEAPAQVTAKHMQTVVERTKYAHHGVGAAFAEAQALGGVQHQRGIQHGKTQGGKDLDKEQCPGARGDGMALRRCRCGVRWSQNEPLLHYYLIGQSLSALSPASCPATCAAV